MHPAATRPAWRHKRVEFEHVVNCGWGSNAPPESPLATAMEYTYIYIHRIECSRVYTCLECSGVYMYMECSKVYIQVQHYVIDNLDYAIYSP